MVDWNQISKGDKVNSPSHISIDRVSLYKPSNYHNVPVSPDTLKDKVEEFKHYQRINGKGKDNMINSDDIERNGFKWYSANNIPRNIKDGDVFIVNTDTSDGQGIHWMTVCKRGNNIYLFDPLGANNPRDNDEIIQHTLSLSGNLHVISKKAQGNTANICGWIALLAGAIWKKYPYDDPLTILNRKIKGDATDEVIAVFGLH